MTNTYEKAQLVIKTLNDIGSNIVAERINTLAFLSITKGLTKSGKKFFVQLVERQEQLLISFGKL